MKTQLYDQLAEVEDTHWWFTARRALVSDVLRRCRAGGTLALDIGCGTGGHLSLLADFCDTVVGLDRSRYALTHARAKHPRAALVCGDALHLARLFRAESFDVVTLFNVLYHQWVPSPQDVLEQVHQVLRPGGLLLLTEPAYSWLMRGHDAAGLGARRFSPGGVETMMRHAGFVGVEGTCFNALGLPPALVLAAWERLRGGGGAAATTAEIAHPPRIVEWVFSAAMAAERQVVRRGWRVPVGLTLCCHGEKRL
ncbi:class I SAM-dependent methyltransferase [Desulfobaculum senezii]